MLLENKNAVLFAAGGSVGGAISRALAKAGAKVFLSNHHIEPVQKLAKEIIADGGKAEAFVVDALKEKEVNKHAGKEFYQSLPVGFPLITLRAIL